MRPIKSKEEWDLEIARAEQEAETGRLDIIEAIEKAGDKVASAASSWTAFWALATFVTLLVHVIHHW